ncbi:Uncharacterised protein [Mycobacteroides abscessus]|nr:Uncharacterised protein [Mycobacteroides abscessus]
MSTFAPSALPISMYDRIFSSWSFDACAPIIVSVSSGLPCRTAFVRSIASPRNVS